MCMKKKKAECSSSLKDQGLTLIEVFALEQCKLDATEQSNSCAKHAKTDTL